MRTNSWKKKWGSLILCGMIGVSLQTAVQPVPSAQAAGLGDILGTVVQGVKVKQEVDAIIKHYDQTEEGRQELFAKYQKEYGVSENYYRKQQLDEMMPRLTKGVAAADPSILKKPYLYFINKQTSFNAFCSMGHVMSVNEGLYSLTDNPDEIAVVLAHEMGHGQKNHVASSMRKKLNVAIGAAMIGSAVGSSVANAALKVLVNQIDKVSITKKDEWEADNLALDYVINAGYNPGAAAALWQRVEEKYGKSKKSFVGEIFSPSDHPTQQQRRENYVKKLFEYSGKHVTVEKGVVKVNGKALVKPSATEDQSGAERSYFVLGNLAAAYHNGHNKSNAYASGNTLMLGQQPIMACHAGDPSASELADLLNRIK